MKKCKTCGNEFTPVSNQLYCGDPCLSPSTKLWGKGKLGVPTTCRRCGKEFVRVHGTQTYCTPRCRRKASQTAPMRECLQCKEKFAWRSGVQKFCSVECRKKFQGINPGPEPRDCVRCGKEYTPASPGQRYCSEDCKKARNNTARWRLNPNIEYRQETWRRHVAELCGHRCVDCGRTAEEAGSLHAHHIIPRKRGGKNVVRNGMLLCHDCHTVRHDPDMAGDDFIERLAVRVVELLS